MASSDVDLTQLSDDELMERWTALGEEANEIKAGLKEYSAEHQRRERERQLQAFRAQLSDADLDLLQSMEPVGIESEEAVMTGE